MTPAIIVHGGAGPARADDDGGSAQEGCLAAARAGYAVLASGGGALDAVQRAVMALEDDPRFNAGTGSCLNEEGEVEMDASLMDGATLRAGAVTLVRGVRNPIALSRCVMDRTRHVFLAGDGALRLARECGLELRSPAELITPRALARWKEWRARAPEQGGGTVGAVAIDAQGHVAAATSTGGMLGKRVGRIGDSPLIGCGTYADDLAGAASATGHGEAIIRVVLSRFVCDAMRAGRDAQSAADAAMGELGRVGGEGGIITVDRHGRLGAAFNTDRMSRAWVAAAGQEGTGFGPPIQRD